MSDSYSCIHWHAQFKHLKPWTDVATKGLSEDSRARVLEEITAHFEDAIEAGMRRCLSEEEAARRAVEDLGSAWRAQLAFRRTYLTRLQASTLGHLVETPLRSAPVYCIVALSMIAQILYLDAHPSATAKAVRFAMLGVVVLSGFIRTVAVPRIFRQGRRRAAVVLGGTAEFLLWTCFVISGRSPVERHLWLVAIFVLIMGLGYIPLAIKIERQHLEELLEKRDHPKE